MAGAVRQVGGRSGTRGGLVGTEFFQPRHGGGFRCRRSSLSPGLRERLRPRRWGRSRATTSARSGSHFWRATDPLWAAIRPRLLRVGVVADLLRTPAGPLRPFSWPPRSWHASFESDLLAVLGENQAACLCRSRRARSPPSGSAAPRRGRCWWKMPGEGVVVGGRDRVELVVVAAGAVAGQAEDRAASTVSICSSTLSMTNRTLNRWFTSLTPSAEEPGRDQVLGSAPSSSRQRQEVARRSAPGRTGRTACRR